jgi:FMN reductase
MTRPYIVGLGGTTRADSSTQMALSLALETVRQQGADTVLLGGSDLDLPSYVFPGPKCRRRKPSACLWN